MPTIKKIIVEPSNVVKVNQGFTIKVLVEDEYLRAKNFITENEFNIITEDGNLIRTEWGYE